MGFDKLPRREKILIVDDLARWRILLNTVLSNEYDTVLASTYEEAIAAIKDTVFKVAVLDIRLEDTNTLNVEGVGILRQIRAINPETRIVILTGHRESVPPLVISELQLSGEFDFVDKNDFDLINFRKLINELIQKKCGE